MIANAERPSLVRPDKERSLAANASLVRHLFLTRFRSGMLLREGQYTTRRKHHLLCYVANAHKQNYLNRSNS